MKFELRHAMQMLVAALIGAGLLFHGFRSQANDKVGIYFDTLATVNCLPDSTHFPFSQNAYLVLQQPSVSSIGGWEGRLDWDPTLLVSLTSLAPSALNLSAFPSFSVGIPSAQPADSLTILATFNVIVLGPGAIYLKPAPFPSLLDCSTPVYADGANPSNLLPMQYAYGDSNKAAASVGVSQCPLPQQDAISYIPFSSSELDAYAAAFNDPSRIVKVICDQQTFALGASSWKTLVDCQVSNAAIASVLTQYGVDAVGRAYPRFDWSRLDRVTRTGERVTLIDLSNVFYLRCSPVCDREALVRALGATAGICHVGPPIRFAPDAHLPTEKAFTDGQLWNLHAVGGPVIMNGTEYYTQPNVDIDGPEAWHNEIGKESVSIGIVDQGVNPSHPDFAWYYQGITDGMASDHATQCAGVACARHDNGYSVGVAGGCPVMDLDVDACGSIVEAIQYGIDNNVSVLNHSYHCTSWWSGDEPVYDPSHEAAVANANKMNICQAFAMANFGNDPDYPNADAYPAGYTELGLSVGSVDWSGYRSAFSGYKPYIDVVAPGEYVYVDNANRTMSWVDGTSFAAPAVAGIEALMLSEYPELSLYNDDIEALINLSAKKMPHMPTGHDDEYGWGIASAGGALALLQPPYQLLHGNTGTNGWQEIGTLGPYNTWLYGFDEVGGGACRVLYHYWRKTGVPVPGEWADPGAVRLWHRAIGTTGYFQQMPIINANWGAVSANIQANGTINASTLQIEVWDLLHGTHFLFPPTSEICVAFSAWGAQLDVLTGVGEGENRSASRGGAGLATAPNPFNAKVRIECGPCNEGDYVSFAIFDVRGRLVRSLGSAPVSNGIAVSEWNGRDSEGRPQASGLYFVHGRVGGENLREPILLAK